VSRALILDFDGSVLPLPEADAIPLHAMQEAVRFGCRMQVLRTAARQWTPLLEANPSPVFLGSGDFHHVTYTLVERLRMPIQVVVFDNHPDNMRYPFGIHCGSWVWHVSRLPFVARVHVVGITSNDVEGGHVVENHLRPLYSGKVRYWCMQKNLRWMRTMGIRHCRSFPSSAELLDAFSTAIGGTAEPIYLSIDKDVLAPDVVRTNWDQGLVRLEDLASAIRPLQKRVVGSDVTGDVSIYHYRSRLKRMLSGLDHQPAIASDEALVWQLQHQKVNRRLLSLLRGGADITES
jgi:arginase family enzyme